MFGYAPVLLKDIAMYRSDRISAKDVDGDSYVGVDNLLPNKAGIKKSEYVPTEGRLIKYDAEDILIGNIRPYLKKIWISDGLGGTNGDVLAIGVIDKSSVCTKYLYHVLASDNFFAYDNQHSKGAKMPRGDKQAVMNYELTLPCYAEQKRISKLLDRFDIFCNDITNGLPAEIEARQKQYEYYRDKLLTFKEFKSNEPV